MSTDKRALGRSGPEVSAIGFVPFSPLGKGFPTGKIDDSTAFTNGDIRATI